MLHTDIIFGRLSPRDWLVEDELMQRFTASRYAVRTAIEEMQRRGLVVREPNRVAYVRNYSGIEVEELFEVLETLEAQAIRRMQLPLSAAIIARLETIQHQHEMASKADIALELFACNRAFHEALFAACGNAQLAKAIQLYARMIDPIRMCRIPDRSWRREAAAHHRQMIALLRGTDREALVQLCLDHIEPSKTLFLLRGNPKL